MNKNEVLQQLAEMGTAQNRKIYGRHGIKGEQYGVSMANLKKLKKQIKVDQALAQELWQTGNHDARYLVTMIADTKNMDDEILEMWVQDLDNYVIADTFSGMVSQTPLARQKMESWTGSDSEWIGQVGWNLLAHLAMKDETLPDDYFRPYLRLIETGIHQWKNRVRYSMNNALIAIGIRNAVLQQEAVTVAHNIGPVEVNHGRTGCQTPAAAEYIERAVARKRK